MEEILDKEKESKRLVDLWQGSISRQEDLDTDLILRMRITWSYICFMGKDVVSIRDCCEINALKYYWGLNSESTEEVFDGFEHLGLGEKVIRDVNGVRSVLFVLIQE